MMIPTSHILNDGKPSEHPTLTRTGMTTEPGVPEHDEFWTACCRHARTFDRRMIDDWAKIVDVVLVYTALFTSALSAFSIETIRDFQPKPGDVTNKILIAIYNQTMNASHPIDFEKYLRLDENTHGKVVYRNVVLFSSLTIAVVIGALATMARIWIIRYDREVSGLNQGPLSYTMKRQEVYDDSQQWGLGKLIEGLPVMTLLSVFLFQLFILEFVNVEDRKIGFAMTIIFQLGICYLFITSFCGAFIRGAPFHSSISYLINLMFNSFPSYRFKLIEKRISVRPIGIILICLSVQAIIPYLVTHHHIYYMVGIYFPMAGVYALMAKGVKKDIQPRRLSLSSCILWTNVIGFVIVLTTYSTTYFGIGNGPWIFYGCFTVTTVHLLVGGYILIKISAIKADTTAVNAVGWFLKTSPFLDPTWFQKAVQIAGDSHNFRVLLLEHLLALAEPLILHTSGGPVQGTTPLQAAYLKSLDNLMDIHSVKGNFWRNEASIPSKALKRKLEELANINCPQTTDSPSEDCQFGAEACPHCRIRFVAKYALEKFGVIRKDIQDKSGKVNDDSEKQDIERLS